MKAKSNYIVRLIISIWVLWLVIAAPGWGATYYVDVVNGSDGNLGASAGDAWKTLHYAVPLLEDGDTLKVAAGTYSVTNGEEADAPLTVTQNNITIQGTDGTVIDGESNSCLLWDSAFEINASNVTIKNLKITNFTCDALGENIHIVGGSNNRIESCDISNSGIGIRFSYSSTGSNNVVENCAIHNHISRGIEIVRDSPQILRNQIYENGTNIYIYEDSGQTIRPVIANNLIYGMSSPPGTGIEIYAYSTGSTVAGQIFHNTLVNSGQFLSRGVYVYEESPGEKVKIQFNIITGFETGILDGFPGAGALEFNYNNVINNATDYNGVATGNNDISMDPLFVDTADLDFHLVSTSPLLNLILSDAGDTVADDLDGIARPNGIGREMGCFEIDNTTALWVHNVASGTGYNRLVMPDINADGCDELLLFEDYEQIRVISGADGTTELWSYVLSAEPSRGRRGIELLDDLDGDGILDILVLVGNSDRTNDAGDDAMYVLSGAIDPSPRVIWGPIGHEGTSSPLGCGLYQPLIVPDVDGDGINDIFANVSVRGACYNSDAGLLFSGADGTRMWYFTDGNLWDVYGRTAAPDLNNDKFADIVVSGASAVDVGGVQAWAGGGDSAVQIWSVLRTDNITTPEVVGDANMDGVPDIGVGKFHVGTCPASPDPRLYILSGTSGATLWQYPLERTPSSIESLGDVNHDGIEDVVIGTVLANNCGGTDSSVYAFDGFTGAEVRLLWSYSLTDQNSYVKVVADANGDGKKDVVVSGQENRLVLLSGADGSVLAQESFPNGSGTVQPGEFNNAAGGDILTSMGNSIYAISLTGVLGNDPPAKPTPLSPADEAVFADSTSIKLKSSAFSDPEGDAQTGLTWTLVRADSKEPAGSFPVTFDQGPFPTEYHIPDQLLEGLKYTWQVGHKDDQGREVWSEERSFKIGTSIPDSLPSIDSGTTLVDFGMISVVHWPDNPLPGNVFNIKYNPKVYRIGTYDPVLGRYIEFGPDLVIEPGRAYWMLARDGLTVNFDGVPVSKETYIEVCLHHNGNVNSPDGWNMIAPPNDMDYDWGDVMVGVWNASTDEKLPPVSISNLSDDSIIDRRVWEWKNGNYKSYMNDSGFVLEPYNGYWVKAVKEGAYLVFPSVYQVKESSSPKTILMAVKKRAFQWIKDLMPSTQEAIADDDLPPMPMGGFEDSVDPVFEGCFVQTLR